MSSIYHKRIWSEKINKHDTHWSSESLWHRWSSDSFEEAEIYWVFTRNCYNVWILLEKPKAYWKPWEKPIKIRCFTLWSPSRVHFGSCAFALFVNGLKSAVTNCDLRLYADDTCLVFGNENFSSIQKHLNIDFNSLCQWFIDN